jgi:hypothetical protein
MRCTLLVVTLLALAACGKDAVSPPPPVIVKLIMAPDTGFWRGNALRLLSLLRGAVTAAGDTIAAPAVTWSLPAGFIRQGDSVLATREARGALRASLESVTDSTATVAMEDLSAPGKVWRGEYRCFGGTWDATRTTDSVFYLFHEGSVFYSELPWKTATYQAVFRFDSVTTIAYLSDGSVVTTGTRPNNGERHIFQQDTLSLSVVAGADTIPMQRPVDLEDRYQAEAPVCSTKTGWQRDGTMWELTTAP